MFAQSSKRFLRDIPKRIDGKNSDLSVTSSNRMDAEGANVTLDGADKPAKRYRLLKPWLELASLAAPLVDNGPEFSTPEELADHVLSFFDRAPDTLLFPANEIRAWFNEATDRMRARSQLVELAMRSAETFLFCASGGNVPEDLALQEVPSGLARLMVEGGRLEIETLDPYHKCFLPAVGLVEIARIRRCPMCHSFFYALRTAGRGRYNAGSKACPGRCTQTWRQRAWRRREAERVEKAWVLHRAGKDATAIARELRISIGKARSFLVRARKEHKE